MFPILFLLLILTRGSVAAGELAAQLQATLNSETMINTLPVTTRTNSPTLALISPATNFSLTSTNTGASTQPVSAPWRTVPLEKRPAMRTGFAAFFFGLPGNGNFGLSGIEAGYGWAYDADSVVLRGRNGTAMEETRYLFVKKVVKF